MTKTEERLLERVRCTNDRGMTCRTPVQDKKGAKRSWRRGGGYEAAGPNKVEEAAWERIVARGDVIKCFQAGYVIPGHPLLATYASQMDLQCMWESIEKERQHLSHMEANYVEAVDFVKKYKI